MAYYNQYNNNNAEEEVQKVSKFNSGMAQIQRLHDLWLRSHVVVMRGDLRSWNWVLDRIWLELIGDIKVDDKRIEAWNDINKKIAELLMKLNSYNIILEDFRTEYYKSLIDKESFLRRLQNELGKGTKFEDLDEDSIEEF